VAYAGGFFRHIGIEPRNRLAAIDISGTLLEWNPDAGVHALTSAHALSISGNTVYVAGDFTTLRGSLRLRLGAVSATGAGDLVQ
jgi:hypothetical protein